MMHCTEGFCMYVYVFVDYYYMRGMSGEFFGHIIYTL